MGGQQSSRKLSVENEDSNNVIKVSERVVERLKGSVQESARENTPQNPPPRSYNTVTVEPQQLPSSPATDTSNSVPYQTFVTPTVTSLDMKKHYEEELRKNNDYWARRIKDVEISHDRINEIWHNEYKKTIEEAELNPMIPIRKQEILPCVDTKSVVMECYKKNGVKPLLCANEVQAFSDCVNSVKFRKAMQA